MKIRLTPTAITQLGVINATTSNETGFIIGQDIGKFRIIEYLLPVNFNETTINEIYAKVYNETGGKLIGVFFNQCEPFFSDWFIEDIVMKIESPQPEFYLYNENKKYVRLADVELKRNDNKEVI